MSERVHKCGAMMYQTDDLRITGTQEVIAPADLIAELPPSERAAECTHFSRQAARDILHGRDARLIVVVGPCSIHNVDAALDYADKLRAAAARFKDDLHIIMRVYFEKPRTTVGWKGLINDPGLDDSFEIGRGLRLARGLLLQLNEMGLSAGTEYLDPISPQYVSDLISWGAIGARTTESQVHRELASGLSCPVGFKNGTDGNLKIAIDAIGSASRPHHFLSVTKAGHSAIFSTSGNEDCHVILRGGKETNYDVASVEQAARALNDAGQRSYMMIDCSHANSRKQHDLQLEVGQVIADQISAGDKRIIGVMIESNLVAGRQDLVEGKELVYGQSITDACINWEDTTSLLEALATAVAQRRHTLSA